MTGPLEFGCPNFAIFKDVAFEIHAWVCQECDILVCFDYDYDYDSVVIMYVRLSEMIKGLQSFRELAIYIKDS